MRHPDRKALRYSVDELFERYRLCKYENYQPRKASSTKSYDERFHGPTGVTSDPTANVAVQNVDVPVQRRLFCEKVERAVDKLSIQEYKVITFGYMKKDRPIDDHALSKSLGISKATYYTRRDSAFDKLAGMMGLSKTE